MRNLKGLLSALLLLVFIAPCAEAADITLRFAGQFPDGHYATKLMRDIAGGVNQRTNGRIAIEVYPANKLGDYTLVYEDLMKGRVDMALITNSGQFDPRLELPNLNVFPSYESAAKDFAPDSWLAKRISEYNTRLGVKFLGFHIEGMTGIASTKKIKNPLDPNSNKGVLARVPLTTVYPEIIRSQGYRTVSLPYAGLAAAVHEDSCDAVTGVSTGAAATDLAGVVKYWYNLNYTIETLSYQRRDEPRAHEEERHKGLHLHGKRARPRARSRPRTHEGARTNDRQGAYGRRAEAFRKGQGEISKAGKSRGAVPSGAAFFIVA